MGLTGTGIWSGELRYGTGGVAGRKDADDSAEIREAVAELESLGYSAVWIPDVGGDVFGALTRLLQGTSTMTVATGILNVWMHEAAETAAYREGLPEEQRRRLLL